MAPRTRACRRTRCASNRRLPSCPSSRSSLPFAGARQLLDLADDEIFLQPAKTIDKHRAVEVIELVLEAAGEQTRRFDDLFLALTIQALQHRSRWPRHRGIEAGQAQAAFLFELHPVALDELGVDERHEIARIA